MEQRPKVFSRMVDHSGKHLEIPNPADDATFYMADRETIRFATIVLDQMAQLEDGESSTKDAPIVSWSLDMIRGAFHEADAFYVDELKRITDIHTRAVEISPYMGVRRCILLNELYEKYLLMAQTMKYLSVVGHVYKCSHARFVAISKLAAGAEALESTAIRGLDKSFPNITKRARHELRRAILDFIAGLVVKFAAQRKEDARWRLALHQRR